MIARVYMCHNNIIFVLFVKSYISLDDNTLKMHTNFPYTHTHNIIIIIYFKLSYFKKKTKVPV